MSGRVGAKVSKETAKTGSQWSAKYSANGEYGLAGSQLAVSQQPVQQSERQSVHAPIAISSVSNGCNRTKARLDGFALVGLMDCHDQALTVGHALGVAGCSLTVAVTGALPINGCAGTCTCHQPVGKHVDVEVHLVGLEPRRLFVGVHDHRLLLRMRSRRPALRGPVHIKVCTPSYHLHVGLTAPWGRPCLTVHAHLFRLTGSMTCGPTRTIGNVPVSAKTRLFPCMHHPWKL